LPQKAEFQAKVKPKLPNQFKAAEAGGVPFAIILGEDELAQGKCKLKAMGRDSPPSPQNRPGRQPNMDI
jgi:histidyl-tRNA synthetase